MAAKRHRRPADHGSRSRQRSGGQLTGRHRGGAGLVQQLDQHVLFDRGRGSVGASSLPGMSPVDHFDEAHAGDLGACRAPSLPSSLSGSMNTRSGLSAPTRFQSCSRRSSTRRICCRTQEMVSVTPDEGHAAFGFHAGASQSGGRWPAVQIRNDIPCHSPGRTFLRVGGAYSRHAPTRPG